MVEASEQREAVTVSRAEAEQNRRKAQGIELLNRHPFVPPFWLGSPHVQRVSLRSIVTIRNADFDQNTLIIEQKGDAG